jgi:prepilin peptidase CpaA
MPMFLLGGMGAGDVKLLAALGAWLGPALRSGSRSTARWPAALLAVVRGAAPRYLGTAFKTRQRWRVLVALRPAPMTRLTLERRHGPGSPTRAVCSSEW